MPEYVTYEPVTEVVHRYEYTEGGETKTREVVQEIDAITSLSFEVPGTDAGAVEITSFPYETADPAEVSFLSRSPLVREVSRTSRDEGGSAEPSTNATPAAERKAAEAQIPLSEISGTGDGGKITVDDVQRAVAWREGGEGVVIREDVGSGENG